MFLRLANLDVCLGRLFGVLDACLLGYLVIGRLLGGEVGWFVDWRFLLRLANLDVCLGRLLGAMDACLLGYLV